MCISTCVCVCVLCVCVCVVCVLACYIQCVQIYVIHMCNSLNVKYVLYIITQCRTVHIILNDIAQPFLLSPFLYQSKMSLV